MSPAARRRALLGALLLAALLVLAALARGSWLTGAELRLDRRIAAHRSPGWTSFFTDLTSASAEAVGLGLLAVGLAVLLFRRRRVDAARLLVTAGAAWVFALLLKSAVDRPRPPAAVQAVTPDNSGSFPSGHDTTATLVLVIVLVALAGTGLAVWLLSGLALLFALGVGLGRVYLGDHYPSDVLGSYLTVAAVTLLVWSLFELPRVRGPAVRLTRTDPGQERLSVGPDRRKRTVT